MKIYCLYDKKSGEYSCIGLYVNRATFERAVASQVNAPGSSSLLATNSSDFDLYCIGSFDVKTAEIVPCHEFICCCNDLKEI